MYAHNFMGNITLSIPKELHDKIKKHNEVRWSQLVRDILQKKISEMELAEEIVSKSKLTSEDAFEIGEEIKKGIAKRHKIK